MIMLKAINKLLCVEATGGGVHQGAIGSPQSASPLGTPPSPRLALPPKPQAPTTSPWCREGRRVDWRHLLRSETRKGPHTHPAWEERRAWFAVEQVTGCSISSHQENGHMGPAQVIPCPVCQGHPRLTTTVSNSTVSSKLSWATSSPQVAAALVHCAAKSPEAFVPRREKRRN